MSNFDVKFSRNILDNCLKIVKAVIPSNSFIMCPNLRGFVVFVPFKFLASYTIVTFFLNDNF